MEILMTRTSSTASVAVRFGLICALLIAVPTHSFAQAEADAFAKIFADMQAAKGKVPKPPKPPIGPLPWRTGTGFTFDEEVIRKALAANPGQSILLLEDFRLTTEASRKAVEVSRSRGELSQDQYSKWIQEYERSIQAYRRLSPGK
jgi:hypothetical protein